ncbi:MULTISPECIES: dUTP diphosphatase [unclassified Roseitalea]|uniref:dUTP diphosphatase n=1 Tax=unclassified Roseitalea TaxID=2639107 RepID=UPI00273E5F7D|nr:MULTISPECIES: dUTP diphosphatase [unclassified Roseitalea]
MRMPPLHIHRLKHARGLALPAYETAGAAGMDLRAAVPDDAPILVEPGDRRLVPTGLIIAVPPGYEAQIRPRSGLALRYGITCLNTPGTIDSDYRGEVQILLANLGTESFLVTRNMRVAQMVITPIVHAVVLESATPPGPTERDAGGFGSTGLE